MLIVIPVSKVDVHLARLLAKRIVELGGVSEARAYVVGTENDLPLVEEIAQAVSPAFKEVRVGPLQGVREGAGWPVVCNDMFFAACRYLNVNREKSAFYFMEADNTPLKADWYTQLSTEYYRARNAGSPFYGSIMQTKFLQPDQTYKFEGVHLNGSAIYPAGFPEGYTILHHYMSKTREAWDIYLRNVIRKHGMADTGLIQNNWITSNYRRNAKGEIICDGKDGHNKPITDRAVVLHGCKDDSLYKCLSWCNMAAYTASEPAPAKAVVKRKAKTKRRKKAAPKPAKAHA